MPLTLEIAQQFTSAWNRRDFQSCRDLCHPDYVYAGPDGKELTGGPEVSTNVAQMYTNAFPDAILTIDRAYPQEGLVVVEMTGRGTHKGPFMGHAPTGKRVEVKICSVLEIRDGKIRREREYFDLHTMLTQIGAVGGGVGVAAARKT